MSLRRALSLLWLLALATTALTLAEDHLPVAALSAAALGLGWLKARLILRGYLQIDAAPAWRGGLLALIGGALAVCWALSLAGRAG